MRQFHVFLTHCALGLLVTTGTVYAQNVFRGVASTADGYSTFDADMIDVENVTQTGAGVYVAVLDTGLAPNWKDYFPQARIAEKLGKGFYQSVTFKAMQDKCGLGTEVGTLRETTFVGSRGTEHGTHVTSTILGFFYRSNVDAASGFPIPPIMVRGIAPNVTVIPVKVLADYRIPAAAEMRRSRHPAASHLVVFGTDAMVAAGINYATDLAIAGYRPMVINMSLGGSELVDVEKAALDRAIANGVIVVASAGNEGDAGMGFPGAYPPVISVAAAGWNNSWVDPVRSADLPHVLAQERHGLRTTVVCRRRRRGRTDTDRLGVLQWRSCTSPISPAASWPASSST